MGISVDPIAACFLLVIGGSSLLYLYRRKKHPSFYPQVAGSALLLPVYNSWRVRYAFLPSFLHGFALTCIACAMLDPFLWFSSSSIWQPLSRSGRAFYLLIDQSGSMQTPASSSFSSPESSSEPVSKLTQVKAIASHLVDSHPTDLIGIMAFARTPHLLVPLTLQHQYMKRILNALQGIRNPEEEGTALGYALFSAARLLVQSREGNHGQTPSPYHIQEAAVIAITDGLQAPHPLDRFHFLRSMGIEEAAEYAKEKAIRFYIVNLDPFLETEEALSHRLHLQEAAELTGGALYLNEKEALLGLDQALRRMAPTDITSPSLPLSLASLFLGGGMSVLLLSVLLDHTLFRRTP